MKIMFSAVLSIALLFVAVAANARRPFGDSSPQPPMMAPVRAASWQVGPLPNAQIFSEQHGSVWVPSILCYMKPPLMARPPYLNSAAQGQRKVLNRCRCAIFWTFCSKWRAGRTSPGILIPFWALTPSWIGLSVRGNGKRQICNTFLKVGEQDQSVGCRNACCVHQMLLLVTNFDT